MRSDRYLDWQHAGNGHGLYGAAAAWEAVAVSQPANPWPLMRAGELYLRVLGEPEMALDRFRLARDAPGITPEQQRYATQKVIDLYLGLLAPVLAGQAEIVYGTRTFGSHNAYSYIYVLGNKAVTTFANLLFNCYIGDLETCF